MNPSGGTTRSDDDGASGADQPCTAPVAEAFGAERST
jgi:hypothetical protein